MAPRHALDRTHQVRPGAAPGAPDRGEQDGGDRRPVRDRPHQGPVPAQAGALYQAHQEHEGPAEGRRGSRPPTVPAAARVYYVLPLHGFAHHAALHRGGRLDCLQGGMLCFLLQRRPGPGYGGVGEGS